MRRALFVLTALLAILFVAAPPPAIANTKSGSEPILTVTSVTITSGDINGTPFAITFAITFGGTVFRDDTESAMAPWTSFQRGGPTITATAIPLTVATAPTGTTGTVRDLVIPGALSGPPWRLADCTGTGTAHDGKTDTRKPTALIASVTAGIPPGQLRR